LSSGDGLAREFLYVEDARGILLAANALTRATVSLGSGTIRIKDLAEMIARLTAWERLFWDTRNRMGSHAGRWTQRAQAYRLPAEMPSKGCAGRSSVSENGE
jgi:nucleoside-diphosphate-sugar epimerase